MYKLLALYLCLFLNINLPAQVTNDLKRPLDNDEKILLLLRMEESHLGFLKNFSKDPVGLLSQLDDLDQWTNKINLKFPRAFNEMKISTFLEEDTNNPFTHKLSPQMRRIIFYLQPLSSLDEKQCLKMITSNKRAIYFLNLMRSSYYNFNQLSLDEGTFSTLRVLKLFSKAREVLGLKENDLGLFNNLAFPLFLMGDDLYKGNYLEEIALSVFNMMLSNLTGFAHGLKIHDREKVLSFLGIAQSFDQFQDAFFSALVVDQSYREKLNRQDATLLIELALMADGRYLTDDFFPRKKDLIEGHIYELIKNQKEVKDGLYFKSPYFNQHLLGKLALQQNHPKNLWPYLLVLQKIKINEDLRERYLEALLAIMDRDHEEKILISVVQLLTKHQFSSSRVQLKLAELVVLGRLKRFDLLRIYWSKVPEVDAYAYSKLKSSSLEDVQKLVSGMKAPVFDKTGYCLSLLRRF